MRGFTFKFFSLSCDELGGFSKNYHFLTPVLLNDNFIILDHMAQGAVKFLRYLNLLKIILESNQQDVPRCCET